MNTKIFKPNFIFKTIGAFCSKSFSKDVVLYKKQKHLIYFIPEPYVFFPLKYKQNLLQGVLCKKSQLICLFIFFKEKS